MPQVSTHSRLKAAGEPYVADYLDFNVSTHSRLKAAGSVVLSGVGRDTRFNTQPPEGGWESTSMDAAIDKGFNTQPPEGGWESTSMDAAIDKGFNTQPPEGGWAKDRVMSGWVDVSTHSRLKAAGPKTAL